MWCLAKPVSHSSLIMCTLLAVSFGFKRNHAPCWLKQILLKFCGCVWYINNGYINLISECKIVSQILTKMGEITKEANWQKSDRFWNWDFGGYLNKDVFSLRCLCTYPGCTGIQQSKSEYGERVLSTAFQGGPLRHRGSYKLNSAAQALGRPAYP